jgi:hypothetical protein
MPQLPPSFNPGTLLGCGGLPGQLRCISMCWQVSISNDTTRTKCDCALGSLLGRANVTRGVWLPVSKGHRLLVHFVTLYDLLVSFLDPEQ